ncbi:hypothetical protein J6590_053482 [Homalodisca vitripennis]|nr:hypothetical protein J6590_053482 [Homalodisca vitripennis]
MQAEEKTPCVQKTSMVVAPIQTELLKEEPPHLPASTSAAADASAVPTVMELQP